MKRTITSSLGVIAFGLSLAACGGNGESGGGSNKPVPEEQLPGVSAEALCDLIFGCDCDDPGHADQTACVDSESTELSEDQMAAQEAGLIYDAQCAGNLVGQAEAAGCAPEIEFSCDSFCAVYHGDVALDQPCTLPVAGQGTWSDCAQGLWCLGGTCQDPCGGSDELLGLGDRCRSEGGESLGTCDPDQGLWCDYETGMCIELPGVGEPCYGSEVCGPGAVCDFSGDENVCVAVPGAGETCTYACDEGLYCDGVDGADGVCVALPGAGEPCALQGQCAEGNYCNGSVCEALPAWVCESQPDPGGG